MSQKRSLDFLYIPLRKILETDSYADYIFCSDVWVPDERYSSMSRQIQTNFGHLRIDKTNGEVQIIRVMPEDDGNRAARATRAIKKEWKNGNLPAETCWASG